MTVKKKILVFLIITVGILLAGWVGNAILLNSPGNPVSHALARLSANQYISNNHPDSDYEISTVWYDEKSELYCVELTSTYSADSHFTLEYNQIGMLIRNSYEYLVAKKSNTAIRLSNEYNSAVKEVLTTTPYSAELHCVGTLLWQCTDGTHDDAHYINSGELMLDGTYDLTELGAKAGDIWIKVKVNSADLVTVKNLAEILLYVRETLTHAGLPFYRIDCLLEYPNGTSSKRIDLDGFLYENIFVEGLESRIEEALIS